VGVLWKILTYFAGASPLRVPGAGSRSSVPFLSGSSPPVHWLTERQFIDAVAVSMITPGPVVIHGRVHGYLVAGLAGAILAGDWGLLPCISSRALAPHFHEWPRTTGGKRSSMASRPRRPGPSAGARGDTRAAGAPRPANHPHRARDLGAPAGPKKNPEPVLILAADCRALCCKGHVVRRRQHALGISILDVHGSGSQDDSEAGSELATIRATLIRAPVDARWQAGRAVLAAANFDRRLPISLSLPPSHPLLSVPCDPQYA